MFPRAAAARRSIPSSFRRKKTTSAQHVASRHRDHTFEKLMDGYKTLIPVLSVHEMILSSPDLSIPLPLLASPESLRLLRLRRGPAHFIRSFPAVFSLRRHPLPAVVHLTAAASRLSHHIYGETTLAVDRITRLLSLSTSRSLPLRSLIRVSHEFGFPRDFVDSVINNPTIFSISSNPSEPNTHLISLACPAPAVVPAVESCGVRVSADRRFGFNQIFPPGMRLTKGYRSRLKAWQDLPYPSIYEPPPAGGRKIALEKRAVAIAHEFLSLTVEKMVEVEKFSHFRKSFGIELNVRDLFLDHPGMFYLSAKGRRHTVFLREAYDRGCLLESNPMYEARKNLLHLVLMRKRGAAFADSGQNIPDS